MTAPTLASDGPGGEATAALSDLIILVGRLSARMPEDVAGELSEAINQAHRVLRPPQTPAARPDGATLDEVESEFSPRCLQVPHEYPDGPRSYQWELRVTFAGGADVHVPVQPYEGATASQIHAALCVLNGAISPTAPLPDTASVLARLREADDLMQGRGSYLNGTEQRQIEAAIEGAIAVVEAAQQRLTEGRERR
ncbi:MAG TPA: hypothetical protein VIQ30_24335 [Pseudonocardia sp.]